MATTEPVVRVEFSYDDDDQFTNAVNAFDTVLSNLALNGNSLFRSESDEGVGLFEIQVEDQDSANIVSEVAGAILGYIVDNVVIGTVHVPV
jgi:hypothetical protein